MKAEEVIASLQEAGIDPVWDGRSLKFSATQEALTDKVKELIGEMLPAMNDHFIKRDLVSALEAIVVANPEIREQIAREALGVVKGQSEQQMVEELLTRTSCKGCGRTDIRLTGDVRYSNPLQYEAMCACGMLATVSRSTIFGPLEVW